MIPSLPSATESVTQALESLVTDLSGQAGPAFVGLVLYGGLARGRYRPGRSDVNVVVLLEPATATVLKAIAPALRQARRAAAIDAMLMTPAEVPLAALDFPTKFLDIQHHHRVLYGTSDPFQNLALPREAVQRRIAQSLRNLLLRLRHRCVTLADEPTGLRTALAGMARPLAIELSALLRVGGHIVPVEDRTAIVYAAAADALGLDAATLSALAALRDGQHAIDAPALLEDLLALLSGLADQVDRQAAA